jgi:hypothetical protein
VKNRKCITVRNESSEPIRAAGHTFPPKKDYTFLMDPTLGKYQSAIMGNPALRVQSVEDYPVAKKVAPMTPAPVKVPLPAPTPVAPEAEEEKED